MLRSAGTSSRKTALDGTRQLAVEYRPLAALIPYARNPRTHSDGQVAEIAASMREFGWTNPILVDGENGIIAGHGRLLAARQLGMAEVPVIELAGLSEAQKRAYVIADNKLALNAGWDVKLLGLELGELEALGFDLSLTGFGDMELAGLLAPGTQGLTDPDAVPDVPEEPVSRSGDLWLLGKHRLLCGDSTSPADVERLLAGVAPHLMVTDPPYGVDYRPDWRSKAGVNRNKSKLGTVRNDDRADWREAWALFPGEVAYVWHAGRFASIVQESLEACGFDIRAQIVWAKDRFALSRGHYHWQHEPCQPAGTMIQKVMERGAGSQPAKIEEVPIETLRAGDFVVSCNPSQGVVHRRGRQITRFGVRQFSGLMHSISAAGRVTRSTPEHRFSVRLSAYAAHKQVVYLMRRGDWWRVGRVGLFNSRGFGLSTRLADNKAEEAWIISVHDTSCEAQCAEQVLSCRYGIPTTHWEVDRWAKAPERARSPEMIAAIYAKLDLSALAARATLLLRDHRLERDQPLITAGERLMFSRKKTRLVRACNMFAEIMQIPMPIAADEFEWGTVTGNDATPFTGPVYSMDVDEDLHYVADGLVTHNCWYAVKGTAHWNGDRSQSTLWTIPARDDRGHGHGTQKPVECMRRPLLNNSSPGQAVYEPFSGSGTTIIAAETTGRICHAMEIDPAYVDVAVTRWAAFTGKAALLEEDGRVFADVAAERRDGGEAEGPASRAEPARQSRQRGRVATMGG
jgi:DNA modification methylase